MALIARPQDEVAEMADVGTVLFDPLLHAGIDVGSTAPREEFDPELFKVAGESRG